SEFPLAIESAVASSDVLLVLIGKQWLDFKSADGRRRLDDPADFVRREIATALKHSLRVIPVLLNHARLPDMENLPSDLQRLVEHQAIELTEERWDYDLGRLITALGGKTQARLKQAGIGIASLAVALAVLAFYGRHRPIDFSGKWTATVPYEFTD